ncbi:hypothetical protein LXA43DRAFT_98925 [Ganoderma leucocontextum]|nr:hypothetical protein LXA43DRAFT_98925 [Ganoderma leucocontextum]
MASNGIDGGMKHRSSKQELCAIGPEFAERLASYNAGVGWTSQSYGQVKHLPYCTAAFSLHPVDVKNPAGRQTDTTEY